MLIALAAVAAIPRHAVEQRENRLLPPAATAQSPSNLRPSFDISYDPLPLQERSTEPPRFEQGFLPNPKLVDAHASSLVELSDGRVRVFWMDGKEGSPKTVVSSSVYDPAIRRWSSPATVAWPETTGRDELRWVRKVGNAIGHRSRDGALHLFYVSVGLAGWAASAVNHKVSHDDGRTWTPARRLVTSPFLNISTLVRQPPVERSDGRLLLPIYHEFVSKYSELAVFDVRTGIVDKLRLNDRFALIQPHVVVQDSNRAIAFMRNAANGTRRYVGQTRTNDGGRHWSAAVPTTLPNPGSPVSAAVLSDGRMLLVFNDSHTSRSELSMAISIDDGMTWNRVHVFEDRAIRGEPGPSTTLMTFAAAQAAAEADATPSDIDAFATAVTSERCVGRQCEPEYSYPSLLRTRSGEFYLTYTWNRKFIRWIRFNQSWLDERRVKCGACEKQAGRSKPRRTWEYRADGAGCAESSC